MAERKEPANCIFNNLELKKWLCGSRDRRRRLLIKLRGDLQKLGLSRPMTRKGLEQLAMKSYVILRRLSISDCRGKLQSSQSSNQNSVPFRKKRPRSKFRHRNDVEKEQRAKNSHDIPQQSDVQIPSVAAEIASIGAIKKNASETCQNKIQEYNLFRTDSSNDTIQDFTSKSAKNNSPIDITSTNRRDISAKRMDIKAASSSSSSENQSLKKHTQNFDSKSTDKSSCPESKTVFPKDKSTSISAKKANISVSQIDFSSRSKSLDTAMSIQVKKRHFDSRRSVESLKNNDLAEQKEKKKSKIEIKQELSLVKPKLIEKSSNESKNDIFSESNASSSRNIISGSKIYSKAKVDSLTNGNQVMSILEEHTQTHVNLKSIHIDTSLCQTSVKKDVNQAKINLEFKNPQIDSPIEINSKKIKRKLSAESLDQNISPIKVRKEHKMDTLPNKGMANNNIEISDYEMLSDDERVHTKQKYFLMKSAKYTIGKEENYKLLKRKRKQHRKECKKKIKNIQGKLHEYFRGSFEPDTSESEEDREILMNYLQRRKQLFDNSMYEDEDVVENIFERDKKLIHDTSTDNLQKSIESAIPAKRKFDNLRDSTTSTEKCASYDTTTDEQTENEASIYEHGTSVNDSQKNIDIPVEVKSGSLSNTSEYTKKHSRNYITILEVRGSLIRARNVPIITNNSRKNMESAIPDEIKSENLCDSTASNEKYIIRDATADERIKNKSPTRDTFANKSQESMKYTIPAKRKPDNLRDSTLSIEKCAFYDTTTDKETENEASTYEHSTLVDDSQKNINIISDKVKSGNLSDTSECTKKHCSRNYTTILEVIGSLIRARNVPLNNSRKNMESAIPDEIKSENLCNSTANNEKYIIYNATANERIKNEAPTCDTSVNKSQKSMKYAIPVKRKPDNLSDFIASIERCAFYDTTTDKETENKASTYEHSTSVNDSQKNTDIPVEVKSGSLSDTSEYTKKHCSRNYTTILEVRGSLIRARNVPIITNNSRKNMESAIPDEIKSKNLCESTASSEKNIHDATADERIKNEAPTCDTSVNKSQENISVEVKSNNCCDSNTEEYCDMHDTTTGKKIKDKASICTSDVSSNNSQENVRENIIRTVEIKSDNSHSSIASNDNSNDSTACIEKNYAVHNAARDNTSVYKYVTVSSNSQENIKNKVPTKEHAENSSLIVDIINSNKNDARTEPSENILSRIERDLNKIMGVENISLNQNIKEKADTTYAEAETVQSIQVALANQKDQEIRSAESVNSPQCKNVQNHATSNLNLPIAFESTCDVGEKDGVSQNVENLLLTNNNNIAGKTIDQLPISVSTSEANSSKRKDDECLPTQTNSSSSNLNYDDDHTSDSNSTDDDNNSNIEIEIKIRPKLKDRISRKFSLKAPWSSVNTCIKDLHSLKANPNFLNEFFQMDHFKAFEKSKRKATNKSPENNTSLNNSENVTIETEDYHTINDSSLTKDNNNVNSSQSQQNFQNYPILNENINTMDRKQKEKDDSVQSINVMTTETSPELNKPACDTPDLGRQLEKTSMDDKQKTNEEQNFPNNATLKEARDMAEHGQENKNKYLPCIEQKKSQMATTDGRNNLRSVETAYNTPNVGEQLSCTSSDATCNKVRIRTISELSCSYTLNSTSLNASKSECLSFCQPVPQSISQSTLSQSVSPQSTLPQSVPQSMLQSALQSAPQTAPVQSVLLQPILPQSASPRLAPPQSALLQSKFPQPAFPRSASLQSTPSQSAPVQSTFSQSVAPQSTLQSAFSQSAPPRLAPPQLVPRLVPPQLAPPRFAPPQSAPPQSASFQSTPQPTYSQFVPPQLIPQSASPQSVPKRSPSCNTADRHTYLSHGANAPIPPVETNNPNIRSNLANLIHSIIKRICINVKYCRNIIEHKFLSTLFYVKNIQGMYKSLMEIHSDLQMLNIWLRMNDFESILTYINQYMPLGQSITMMELQNYKNEILKFYILKQTSEQNNAKSNASQYPNIGGANVPSASMPNAQPFSKNAPNVNMSNHGKFTQPSTIPRPTIPNVSQQQLFGNSVNSQIPDPRQPTFNTRPQYTGYVPPSEYSDARMPNINQQQFVRNAYHPAQSQPMPSANTSNVGVRQSNFNMGPSTGPVNQGVNVPPKTNIRPPPPPPYHVPLKDTSAATAFAANAQQQKQMYPQSASSQMNSGTVINPSVTNQNIAPEMCQSVPNIMSGFSMRSTVVGNVRSQRIANSNQQIPQAASRRAPYNYRISNPNEYHAPFAPQPAHSNMQTYSVHNIQSDQNVQQTLQQKLQRNQRLMQSKDTSACSTNLTTNNMAQNLSQNVPNKGAKIPKSRNRKKSRKNASYINPQENLGQRASSNVSQNTSDPKTFTSQILQPTISEITLEKNDPALILLNSKPAISQTSGAYHFNLAILTDIQKIVLGDQILAYFAMLDQLKCSLNEQEFQQMHHERTILVCLFQNLNEYLTRIITESQTKECIGKDSQDNTSQDRSVQKNTISVDKLTNPQSNRNNKNSSMCNRNLEKQSLKQSSDSNISKNLKPTAANNLTAQDEPLNYMVIKGLLTRDTGVQEQNNDVLKKKFQKSSLVATEKHLENTEVSSLEHSRIPEENSVTEESVKNLEAETQDKAKINESLKISSTSSRTPEENSVTEESAKNLEAETQDNAEINESLKTSSTSSRTPEENSVTEESAKNSETEVQDNAKIDESLETLLKSSRTPENSVTKVSAKNSETEAQDNTQMNESLKAVNSYAKQVPELCSLTQSLTQSPLNLQDALIRETDDQPEIAKNNVNEAANDLKVKNIYKNVATLNNSEENDAVKTSRYNQNEEVYNANDEMSNENLHTVMCDDVSENIEILNSTEIQSDLLNISHDSVPASSSNIWRAMSPIKKSTEMSQMYIAHEERPETTGCLNTQQEDFTNEGSNSTGGAYTEMSESPGRLYIDESVEESQEQKECNKVLPFEEDNYVEMNTLQDSAFDVICNFTEGMPSRLKNIVEAEILNKEFFEPKKILPEISFEDEWNMVENMQPIIKKDAKEESSEQLLEIEGISMKFQIPEVTSSTKEDEMQSLPSIYLKSPEDMEKMEIDTHIGIKTINDQFRHISERNYEKSQTSCKSVQKGDFVDISTEEVFAKNDILNTDIECISLKSDDSEDTIMPNISDIKSISPSLFERMESIDTFLQSDLESLNEKDEKLDMNDLGIPDEVEDKFCLRCKRKSTVYCHCLEAHYCSQRCSFLHWKAKHYKQCKGRNSMISVDK